MAELSLQHVDKIYDNNVQAVFDFNLEVKDKEFIVFVGPSGCGKSTTLRMIAGLEEISAGDFYIDGKRMNDVEPKDRDIAMVFQSYALYPHMSVYENMAFGLKLRKYSKEEIDKMEFTATSNLVSVKVNGKKEVLNVKIEAPTDFSGDDIDMLEDMIMVAVNEAFKQVDKETEKKMGKYTSMMPGLF